MSWIEILGTLLSLIYLYFSVKQNIWLWFWGIVSSALYIVVFFKASFYADMSLQVYYLVISTIGWYRWHLKGHLFEDKHLPVISLNKRFLLVLSLVTLLLYFAITFLLYTVPDKIGIEPSQWPWIDALITSLSIVATYMLMKKIVEHWLIWIVVDIVGMVMFGMRELYFTSFLYFVYSIVAVIGFYQWKKSMLQLSE